MKPGADLVLTFKALGDPTRLAHSRPSQIEGSLVLRADFAK